MAISLIHAQSQIISGKLVDEFGPEHFDIPFMLPP